MFTASAVKGQRCKHHNHYMTDSAHRSEQFVDQVIACQRRIFGYILTLLPDANEASDVLQQTNMAIWRDSGRFVEGTDFIAWALRIAYFKVLEHRQKTKRNRRRFSDALMENLAAESEGNVAVNEGERIIAMRRCLEAMPPRQREILDQRYWRGESVRVIAASMGQEANALATTLFRIRQALRNCIEHRLKMEGSE